MLTSDEQISPPILVLKLKSCQTENIHAQKVQMRRVLLANLYCLWPRLKGDNFSLPSIYTLNFFWLFILARHDKLSRKPAEQCTPIWGALFGKLSLDAKSKWTKHLLLMKLPHYRIASRSFKPALDCRNLTLKKANQVHLSLNDPLTFERQVTSDWVF